MINYHNIVDHNNKAATISNNSGNVFTFLFLMRNLKLDIIGFYML